MTSTGPGAPGSGAAGLTPERPFLALALLRNLRVARSVIVVVILLGLVLPNVVAGLSLYQPTWTGLAWFLGLFLVAVTDSILVARRRTWGNARWPAAAVVFALSVWATALLPPAALVGPAHQTLGAIGWFGVLLFADSGVVALLGFLGVHVALTLVQLGIADRLDLPTLVDLAVVVAISGGFQVAVGAAGAALDRVAAAATEAARRQAATVTAEEVARQLHDDREERYGRLRDSVLPLLRGVGDGSLSPADPRVQRRAALESARLRRLFAEGSDVHDPLAVELGSLVDVVEQRGTEVRFSATGQRPVPPPSACRALVEAVAPALLAARHSARLTLSATGTGVLVGVVADVAATDAVTGEPGPSGEIGEIGEITIREIDTGETAGGEVSTVVVGAEQQTWVEARWTPSAS